MSFNLPGSGGGSSAGTTDVQFTAGSTVTIGLSVKKIASQVSNLFGIYDESNNLLDYYDSTGKAFFNKGAAIGGTTAGFINSSLTTAQRNALTTAAGLQTYDSTLGIPFFYTTQWEPLLGFAKPYYYARLFDHFMGAAIASDAGFAVSVSGTAATAGIGSDTKDATAHGVASLAFGTDTNSRAALGSVNNMHFGNSTRITMEARIWINQLANATDDYYINIFNQDNNTTLDSTNGVYLQYNRAVSANWQIVCRDNSSEDRITSSTAVAAGSWIILRLDVNAAGTSVSFYVNGVLDSTNAVTKVPSTYTRYSTPKFRGNNTAGTGAGRGMHVDYYSMEFIRL